MTAPPAGPLEICFSFDTTVSMTRYVAEVKGRLQDMAQRLQADIPGIKIALFAHGDYYYDDFGNTSPYVTKHIDLTQDIGKLCDFIEGAEPTDGGDWEECYELVLKEAGELSWSPVAQKVLVMIGDAMAHQHDGPRNLQHIDWRAEVRSLRNKKVKVYGVHCDTPNSRKKDEDWFKLLANRGQGSFLQLNNFNSIFDLMMGICYRESTEDGLLGYEKEILQRGGSTEDIRSVFATLKKSASNASGKATQPALSTAAKVPMAKKPGNTKQVALSPKKTIRKKALKVTKAVSVKVRTPVKHSGVTRARKVTARPMKLRRERVPENNFALRDFPWSSWQLVMTSSSKAANWKKRPSGGFRKATVFNTKPGVRALYELAVQTRPGCRKRPVYTTSRTGFSGKLSWEDQLLNRKGIRKQLDFVLQKGCTVHLRRLVLRKARKYDDILETLKMYDYAWMPHNNRPREVAIGETVISKDMSID